MSCLYNEIDPYAAQWLTNLSDAGRIAEGPVDTRSIVDLDASDVSIYERVHFFAGIGGWDLALQIAEWPSHQPVWTGSCPCQPFSQAGQGKGVKDERHLWPVFRDLIDGCRPPVVFGEQVASKAGRSWLSGVQTDLETLGYRVASADLCAAGVGAPHIRQRLFWVGYSDDSGSQGRGLLEGRREGELPAWSTSSLTECRDEKSRRIPDSESGIFPLAYGLSRDLGRVFAEHPLVESSSIRSARQNRVGRLKGYGNAIVPQVAAAFIESFMEVVGL